MKSTLIALATCLDVVACSGGAKSADTSAAATPPPSVAAPTVSPDVQKALAVDSGIKGNPAKADSVLQAHGLTQAGLDSLMYRIAEDSTMRAQYAAARR